MLLKCQTYKVSKNAKPEIHSLKKKKRAYKLLFVKIDDLDNTISTANSYKDVVVNVY